MITVTKTAEDKILGNKPFLITGQKTIGLVPNGWEMYLIFLLLHVFLCLGYSFHELINILHL